ncbi:outer membrane protein assembly factor BamE [Psittacicella hinzii]|uniref:Outer membrane protein assembly factor BamE n=1 Tax=Psittacicella hinzii TaxID=2028575 RepID=A0A3A1YGM6_9GAMM|nr:outer membrane protein assembly factor BamE [Psittacicella hinzii]RIY35374.1 hypothetical protein CKF58_06730 [Psittacicella hinzii]
MRKLFLACLTALSVVSLSACSIIYQPVRSEGTVLTNEQVAQIKNGLTKEQVLYILGTPNVYKTLSEDSWYYVTRDISTRGKVTQKIYVVTFQNNKVVSFGNLDNAAKN